MKNKLNFSIAFKASIILTMCLIQVVLVNACSSVEYVSTEVFDQLHDEYENLNAIAQVAAENVTAIQQQNDGIKSQIANKESSIELLNTRLTSIRSDIDKEQNYIDSLQSELQEKTQRIVELENYAASLETKLIEHGEKREIKLLSQDTDYLTWDVSQSTLSYILIPSNDESSHPVFVFSYVGIQISQGSSYSSSLDERHWNNFQNSNSIIFFNSVRYPYSELDTWPEEHINIKPFIKDELESISEPFIWTKRDVDSGYYRTIVVYQNATQIRQLTRAMIGQDLPIGVPWTVEQ